MSGKGKVLDYRRIKARVHIEGFDKEGKRSSSRVGWTGLDQPPNFPRLCSFAKELTAGRPDVEITEVKISYFAFCGDMDLSRVCEPSADFIQ